MIIAVASRKASPGVTSLTAWLADLWSEPGVTRLIVEADPSGGSLAARWSSAHGLTWDPGLLTLSTSRAALSADTLGSLTQRLADGVLVAAAPPAPEQVIGALSRWGDRGAAELAAADGGVRAFVDCGRLTAASPALTLARRAALTVLVCRPRLDEVNALVPAVAELTAAGCTLGLVCVGSEPYLPAEIANAAGLPLLGVLPVDARAAAVFDRDGLDSGRSFRRSALAQTAAELTEYVRSRAVELLADHGPARAAEPEPGAAADPEGDPTAPDPASPPASVPVAAAAAAPGPTRLSNPVGPATDDGISWPPPRPVATPGETTEGAPSPPPAPANASGPDTAVVTTPPPPPFAAAAAAVDTAPPPPPPAGEAGLDTAGFTPPPPRAGEAGPETSAVTMPPPPPPHAPGSGAPYPGAAATSPLPAGMSTASAPDDVAGPLPPPPSAMFEGVQPPPPPSPGWTDGAPGEPAPPDLSRLPPPPAPEAQVIPVSLAIAAARARAQGQAAPEATGDEAWHPPPPPPPPTGGPTPGPPAAS